MKKNNIIKKVFKIFVSISLFVFCCFLFVGNLRAAYPSSDIPEEAWITNGEVYAITTGTDGTTYVGGNFSYIGPNTGNGAVLDVVTGSPDLTFPKIWDGRIFATVSDGSGGWYIGGNFTKVGDITRNRIAHILSDGSVDSSWDPSSDSTVRVIVVDGSTVYAGGDFTSIGGQSRNYIAALDATTGLATAWDPGANAYVRTFAIAGSTIYAGGDFTSIGGQTRNRIAALDATTGLATAWNPKASGTTVNAIVTDGTNVYVGGDFSRFGDMGSESYRSNIAALDVTTALATAWDPSSDDVVTAIVADGAIVYAGGYFTSIGGQTRNHIAALDATTGLATAWDPNAGDGDVVEAVVSSGAIVYAGGDFTSIGGQTRNRIAALDATTGLATAWDPNAYGNPYINGGVYTLATDGVSVYAGGNFNSIGGQSRNYIAALDATTGLATAWNPNANLYVGTLAIDGSTIYVGGDFTSIGGQSRNYIAALDATTGLATAWDPNANSSMQTIVVDGSTIYIGGDFTSIGGQDRNYIAAFDKTTGLITAWDPGANAYVRTFAIAGSTIYAGGAFTSIGGQSRNYIAALDATTGLATAWDPNANATVYSLIVNDSTVYAGGDFTSIGGQSRNYIAALDATTGLATAWDPNANNTVRILALDGSTLYVGGGFTAVGGQSRNLVATLDKSTGLANSWDPNPSVPGNDVRTFSIYNSNVLYAGGIFTVFGDDPYPYFVKFNLIPDPPTSPTVTTSPATSVSRTSATLNGEITATGGADATTRGFEYGLTTSYGETITQSSGPYSTGTFDYTLSDLACSTAYHYRAYATNAVGTSYGSDDSFITSSCVVSSGGGGGSTKPPTPSPVTPPPIIPPPLPPPIITPPTTPLTTTSPLITPPTTTPPVVPTVVSLVVPTSTVPAVTTPQRVPPALPISNSSRNFPNILAYIRVITNNPVIKMIKNIAIAISLIASFVVLTASVLAGMPFLNYLLHLLVVLSQILGFKKKPKPWGTVYDSYTKRPLPYARVEILNDQARKLQSTITDENGRYGFLISEQLTNIKLRAYLTKYDFPSKKEPSVVEQKLYPNIYKGESINASSGLANYDLPMDPRSKIPVFDFYLGISSIKANNFLSSTANVLFLVGAILGIANAIVNPSVTSITIFSIILLTFILRNSGFKLKPFGLTKDRETNQILPFGLIALHNQGGERVSFTVSDGLGRYFLLTPKGNYTLKAYTPSHIIPTRIKEIPVSTRKGWISREVEV